MARIIVAYAYSPYTTANYIVHALRRMGHEVKTEGPGHLHSGALWPDDEAEAKIWIEAGGGCPEWLAVPAIYSGRTLAWFIDGHSQGAWHKDLATCFHHVFSAQKGGIGEWLPVACDPEIHTPAPSEPECDVVFVGHTYGNHAWYERRRRLIEQLRRRYVTQVYEGVYLREMALAHGRGRVVFNVSTMDDLNMRVFEGMCSGRPLVTNAIPEIDELFIPGVELLTYQADEEVFARIDRLLEHPRIYAAMGRAGRRAVLDAHTYDHRAAVMVEALGL